MHNPVKQEIRFTQSARKHRIGRRAVRFVMASTTPVGTTTSQGNSAWRYVGRDERNSELEIIAVELGSSESTEPTLLVIHVMPTQLKEGDPDG